MIAVWILLGIAALLALALLLPLRTRLHFDAETGLHYRVYYAFVPLYDSDRPAPRPRKRPKTQPAKAGKPAKRKPRSDRGAVRSLLELLGLEDLRSIAAAKRALSEKGLLGLLSDLNAAVGSLLSATFGMLRKAVFRQFSLQIVVGDDDAADAAMRYGRVCAAVYPLLTLLDGTFRFRQRRVDLRCDFDAEETAVRLDALIHLRPWYLLCYLFRLIGNYLKRSAAKHE